MPGTIEETQEGKGRRHPGNDVRIEGRTLPTNGQATSHRPNQHNANGNQETQLRVIHTLVFFRGRILG